MLYCCTYRRHNSAYTIIQGTLEGLPDGMMVLYGANSMGLGEPIDSTMVKNEHFLFRKETKKLPYFLTLELHQNNGNKLLFSFKTNKKYRDGVWYSEYFMRDSAILINGAVKDFNPKDFKMQSGIKLVYPDGHIISGEQTNVLYNVQIDFNQLMTDSIVKALGDTIRQYNYSYYLLAELNANRNNFSKEQLKYLIPLFDSTIQKNDVALDLNKSLKIRISKELSDINFLNQNRGEEKIDLNQSKVTMIILWASWCGPCRMEIPILKKIYQKYSKDKRLKLISISLDSKNEDWQDALKQENMPWSQLILPEKLQPFTKEIFHFDGSIPTTLFFDSSGNKVAITTGFEGNLLKRYNTILTTHLK